MPSSDARTISTPGIPVSACPGAGSVPTGGWLAAPAGPPSRLPLRPARTGAAGTAGGGVVGGPGRAVLGDARAAGRARGLGERRGDRAAAARGLLLERRVERVGEAGVVGGDVGRDRRQRAPQV